MTDDDLDGVDREGAIAVGYKVIEMADRLKAVVGAVPGAQAKWFFEIDDCRFKVVLTVAEESSST